VTWLPFDLHPEYPPEGIPKSELKRRYGEGVDDFLAARFAEAALDFRPSELVPNSRAALRLTELARERGLHEPFHDRLMDAYWSEALDLGDRGVLRDLAAEVGLAGEAVDRVLDGDVYLDRVEASTRQAAALGVSGIPAFLLDRRLLVLGAQPREVFEQAFAQLAGEQREPGSPSDR
jgi:predicted DsbA family dithiol-disulfide isomerase